jgi:hypothetical protein
MYGHSDTFLRAATSRDCVAARHVGASVRRCVGASVRWGGRAEVACCAGEFSGSGFSIEIEKLVLESA